MTRTPLALPLPQAQAQNRAESARPSNLTQLATGVRATLGRVPMAGSIATSSAETDRADSRLASRWQAPKASAARGSAQIDAQQTLFAALKTATQRRAG